MKIKIYALILLSMLAGVAFAELSFHIDIPTPTLRGDSIENGLPLTMTPGEPVIPYKELKILLPFGEKYTGVEIEFSPLREIKEVELPFAREPQPISDASFRESFRNEKVYRRDEFYPYKESEVVGVQRKNGHDILIINVYPYRYNPVTKTLAWSESFDVRVKTEEDYQLAAEQNRFLVKSERVSQEISRLVYNPELINSYTKSNLRHTSILPKLDEPYRMIIISSAAKSEVFAEYIQWKESKGITTGFFSTADIYDNYEGENRPEKIRNFIIDAYQTYSQTTTPLEYVILGGDQQIIPIRGMFGKVGETVDRAMPADIYYSNLDGNWDANGNGIYGEPDDEVDWLAEVALGRIPANSDSQFRNFFRKNYHYVDENTYSNDIVYMLGEKLDENPTYGGDYKDQIIPLLPTEYKFRTLYERDGDFSSAAVVSAINGGLGIINHIGHANFNTVFGLNNTKIYGLKNTEYGFAYTQGCYPAAFDTATSQDAGCVGQNLATAKGGLFAFIGNTRYGWYMPGSTEGPSQAFDITFFEGLYKENIRELGHTMNYSKEKLAGAASTYSVMRWIYYDLVLFGDPSIPVKSPFGEYPYLEPTEIEISDAQGDNDGKPNPGEVIEIYIEVGVPEEWGDAYDVKGKLTTKEPYLRIIQGEVFYGNVVKGEVEGNRSEPFLVELSENIPFKEFELNVELSAIGAENSSFSRNYPFKFSVTLIQENWPWKSEYPISSSPVFTKLSPEMEEGLIVVDDIGNVNFINGNGETTLEEINSGQTLWRSFAIGQLGNDEKSIVLASRKGNILAVSADGDSVFVFNECGEQILTPIVADIDGDGVNEVISFGVDKKLYVLNSKGELLPGFPVELSETAMADLAVADLNDDGFSEVIIGTLDEKLYAINYRGEIVDGFPVELPAAAATAPTVLNNKNIAVGTSKNQLILVSNEGEIIFEREVNGRISYEIIAADFDKSEELQLGFVTNKGKAYIVKQDGSDLEGWPINIGTALLFPPLAVDLNGDGFVNFICYTSFGDIFAYHKDGTLINSFPIPLHEQITSPAMIADIDNDGDFDIVLATSSGITVVDYKLKGGNKAHWSMYRRNEQRTGFWGSEPLTGIGEGLPVFLKTELKQNYPNPFNPETRISFNLQEGSNVKLEVYNVKGQKVATLINDKMKKGEHSIAWNTNEKGGSLASGIYFMRLTTKGKTFTKKMMLLK